MLYIYSDDVPELNEHLLAALGPKHTLTIIPATTRDLDAAHYYRDHFRQAGLRARTQSARFYRDPVRLRNIILNSDAVFLMGGNTFEFLANAQRMALFEVLQEFETIGGIIAADSAGAIILSPNIATALLPTTCPDEQTIELASYLGMGRIPFHISPHFDPAASDACRELDELQALAYCSTIPVMVLQDGEGMILDHSNIEYVIGQPRKLDPAAGMPDSVREVAGLVPVWAASGAD